MADDQSPPTLRGAILHFCAEMQNSRNAAVLRTAIAESGGLATRSTCPED